VGSDRGAASYSFRASRQQAAGHRRGSGSDPIRKRLWRIAGWSPLIRLAVLAFCGYRIAFGKPFTI
jgi:hypothetical protein